MELLCLSNVVLKCMGSSWSSSNPWHRRHPYRMSLFLALRKVYSVQNVAVHCCDQHRKGVILVTFLNALTAAAWHQLPVLWDLTPFSGGAFLQLFHLSLLACWRDCKASFYITALMYMFMAANHRQLIRRIYGMPNGT